MALLWNVEYVDIQRHENGKLNITLLPAAHLYASNYCELKTHAGILGPRELVHIQNPIDNVHF